MMIRSEIANRQTHEERDKRTDKLTYKQADKCRVNMTFLIEVMNKAEINGLTATAIASY